MHTPGYTSGVDWDVQKIDIGIALCHFRASERGEFSIDDSGIEVDEYTEYIATVKVK